MYTLSNPLFYIELSIRLSLLSNLDTFFILDSLLQNNEESILLDEQLLSEDDFEFANSIEKYLVGITPITKVSIFDTLSYDIMARIFMDSYYFVHSDEMPNGVIANHLSRFVFDFMNLHITYNGVCNLSRTARLGIICNRIEVYPWKS